MVSEYLIPAGLIIIFVGFVLLIAGALVAFFRGEQNTQGGLAIFVGPIPVIGASSKEMFYFVLGLSIFLFVIFLIFNRGFFVI